MNFSDTIYEVMHEVLNANKSTLIIGQGVKDQRGIFGTTKNLHLKFPKQIIETPLSEDSIAGVCLGASLSGRPRD